VNSNHDPLTDLLESIEHFLKRVDKYTRIPKTPTTDETVIKIILELLSTLALATKELKHGRMSASVSVLTDVLLYSTPCSQILPERKEERRGSPTETRLSHTRRGSDYRSSDSRSRPRSHPEYEQVYGR
jgi:hypothetical protein